MIAGQPGAPSAEATILVVDDRPVDRDYYRTVLGYGSYRVIEAGDGAEALELVRSRRPDLVLTDVMMPTLDGYALTRAIRSDPEIAATRIIFCTANYREQEARQLATAVGAARFLVKPIEPQALLSAVGEVLGTPGRPLSHISPEEAERAHLQLLNDKLMARTAELEAEIAARRQVEQELREHRDRLEFLVARRTADLEAANRELQSFTYAASHDLRAPLGRIEKFSTLLERQYRPLLEGDGLSFLDFIRQNTRRMTALIDDLLEHSRIEHQELHPQPVDLRGVAEMLVQERADELRQCGAHVRLALPQLVWRADAHCISQVLRNLLENAIKYSAQAAEPLIEIGGEAGRERCRLWVRDNGIGFDMAQHDRIFEILRRLHTYGEYPGSGVGLALVRTAVARMGGKVWAQSEPGRGATFFVEIPA